MWFGVAVKLAAHHPQIILLSEAGRSIRINLRLWRAGTFAALGLHYFRWRPVSLVYTKRPQKDSLDNSILKDVGRSLKGGHSAV